VRFMNDWNIENAVREHGGHPVLGPAARTLANLADWADRNSDGWAYWPKPARAAAKLMELIEGNGTWQDRQNVDARATPAAYRQALAPVKAFRTRMRADFAIEEAA